MSPVRRTAALPGPVADQGLRKWVYQAQAYERTGFSGFRCLSFTPQKNVHTYVRPLDMIQKRSEKCAAASYALTLKPFTLERRGGPRGRMPFELCARRRSRSPPPSDSAPRPVVADCDPGTAGAPAWPQVALPVRLKGGYSEGTALAAPSAPAWSPGGTHFWQRSPLSGVLWRWLTSPTLANNRSLWFAPPGDRFAAPDPDRPGPR